MSFFMVRYLLPVVLFPLSLPSHCPLHLIRCGRKGSGGLGITREGQNRARLLKVELEDRAVSWVDLPHARLLKIIHGKQENSFDE